MTITTPPRTRVSQPSRTLPGKPPLAPSKTPAPGKAQPGRTRPAPAETGSARARSAASQRAYARKAQRHAVHTGRAAVARRAPFVLVVMALLAVGLVTALWLSTAASADSYRLEQARLQARELSERSEQLRQEVAELQAAPKLAERARAQGMVPSGEPARLVVQPDGTVLVVGKPAPATAPAPPVDPATAQPPTGDPAAGQPPAGDAATQPPAGAGTQPPAGDAAQPPPAGDPAGQNQQPPPPAGGG